jgi:hypothetical protein
LTTSCRRTGQQDGSADHAGPTPSWNARNFFRGPGSRICRCSRTSASPNGSGRG